MTPSPPEHPSLLSISFGNSISNKIQSCSTEPIVCEQHLLLCFTSGKGTLYVQDTPVPVKKGIVMLLAPRSTFQWVGTPQLSGTWMSFDVYERSCTKACLGLGQLLPYGRPVPLCSFPRYVHLLEEHISLSQDSGDELHMLRQNIILQEMLWLLLTDACSTMPALSTEEAVRTTIRYIEQHYSEVLTVEQLATQADIGRSQYSSLFQQIAGCKPLDYITRVRIRKAQALLLQTDGPLREIAQNVGFNDEFYFNRRFSQIVGLSPKQYVREQQNETRGPSTVEPEMPTTVSVSTSKYDWSKERLSHSALTRNDASPKIVALGSMVGHMLKLGIRPVGAELSIIRHQVVYRDQLRHIRDVGVLDVPSMIAELHPDLIVYEHRSDSMKEQLERVAPTLTLDSTSNTAEQLRRIAQQVGMEQQAETWITSYETKLESMWRRIYGPSGAGETASVFLELDNEWYVMGVQGFPLNLYHPFGFSASKEVAILLDNQVRFLKIQKHEFARYAGDRIFVLTSQPKRRDQNLKQRLAQTSWDELPSSVRRQTYAMNAKWNFDDPITRERLLKVMPRILKHPLTSEG